MNFIEIILNTTPKNHNNVAITTHASFKITNDITRQLHQNIAVNNL
jgi:hypothetical protein